VARHSVEGRLERALALVAWMHRRDPVSPDELCARFGVSRRQLDQDLAAIETMALGGDRDFGPQLIRHEDGTVSVEARDVWKLHGRLSRQDAFAVLAVGRTAVSLLGSDDAPALESALAKLEAGLEEGRQLAVDIERPEHLDLVRSAIAERRTLEVDYWSAWRDVLSTRCIDPLHAFYAQGEWYVTCYCHERNELRRFRVDRILEARETGSTFDLRPVDPDLEVFTAPSKLATEVVAWFPAAAAWVPEYVAGEVIDANGEGFEMRLTSVGETWLARLLLRTGGAVVGPEDLVDLRRATARRVLARYGEQPEEPSVP
jgi:proteasome accessory factor C